MSVERIATLEEQVKAERERYDQINNKLDGLDAKVSNMQESLNRQKGFIAGAMFVLVPIWSGVLLFAKSAFSYFTAKGDL